MAWPGTLTTEEQTSLLSWVNTIVRPTMGEVARVCNHLDVANVEYNGAQNDTNGNLSKLVGSDVIPISGSGLGGAENLTKDELITLISYTQGILAYNTAGHRGNYARAAGEGNLIG